MSQWKCDSCGWVNGNGHRHPEKNKCAHCSTKRGELRNVAFVDDKATRARWWAKDRVKGPAPNVMTWPNGTAW